MNPLLDFSTLPRFAEIRPEQIAPAVDELISAADAALARATSAEVPAEYEALSAVLDVATERLSRAWSTVNHLNGVADTPELRAAYNEGLPKVVDFHTRLGADERLFAKYKAVLADPRSTTLTPSRKKALANALRDFVLSGAELEGPAKAQFAEVQDRLAECGQKFSEHVLDATDG
ncbi:MAG TPA: oligopeptidase A, partial [Caldimonas sp.]